MTEVRIIKNVKLPMYGIFGVGQDANLPDDVAIQLIAQGAAEERTAGKESKPRVVKIAVRDELPVLDPRDPKEKKE